MALQPVIVKADGSREPLTPTDGGRSFKTPDGHVTLSSIQTRGSQQFVRANVDGEMKEFPVTADTVISLDQVKIRFAETAQDAMASRSATTLPPPQTVQASSAPAMAPGGQVAVADRQSILERWAAADGRIAGANSQKTARAVVKVVDGHFGKRPILESRLRAYYEGHVAKEMARGGRAPVYTPTAAATARPAPTFNPTPSAPVPAIRSGLTLSVEQRESKIVDWATVENRLSVSHPQKLAKAVIKVVDGHYGKRPIPEHYLRAYYNGYVVKAAAKAGATPLPIAPAKSEAPPPAPAAASVKKITFGHGWIEIGKSSATEATTVPPPAEKEKPAAPPKPADVEKPATPEAKPDANVAVADAAKVPDEKPATPPPPLPPTDAKLPPEDQRYITEMRALLTAAETAFQRLAEINAMKPQAFSQIPLSEFKNLFSQVGAFKKIHLDLKSEHSTSPQPEIQNLIRDYDRLGATYEKADQRADRLLRARGLSLVRGLEEQKTAMEKMIEDSSISSKVFRTAKNSWITAQQAAKKEINNVTHIVNESTAKEWNKEIDNLRKEVLALKWSGGSVQDPNLAKALDALQNRLADVEQKLSNDVSLRHEAARLFRDVDNRFKSLRSSYAGKEEARFQRLETRHAEVQQKVLGSQKILLDLIDGYEKRMGDVVVFGPFTSPDDYEWLTSERQTTEGPPNRTLLKDKALAHKNTLSALLGPDAPAKWMADYVVDEARRDLPKWQRQWKYADKLITRVNLYEKSRILPSLVKPEETPPSPSTAEDLAKKEQGLKFLEYAGRMNGHINQVDAIYKTLFDGRGRDRNGHSLEVLKNFQQKITAANLALVEPFDDKGLSLVDQDLLNRLSAERTDKLGYIPKILHRIDRDIKAIRISLPPTALTPEQLGKIDPHLKRVEEIRGQLFEGPGKSKPTPPVEVLLGYEQDLRAAISILDPVDVPRSDDPQSGLKKRIRGQLELSNKLLSYVTQKSKTAEQDARTQELDGIKGQLDGHRNEFGNINGDRDADHEKKMKQLQELRQKIEATLQSLGALKKIAEVEARARSLENGLKTLSGDAQKLEARLAGEKALQDQMARISKGVAKAYALLDTQDPDALRRNLKTLKSILADLELEKPPDGENEKKIIQGKLDEAMTVVKGKIEFTMEKVQKNSPEGRLKQLKERLAEPLQTRLSTSPDGNEMTFSKVDPADIEPYISSIGSHISEIYGKPFQGVLIVVRDPDETRSAENVRQAIDAKVKVAAMAIVRDPSRSDATVDLTLFLNPAPFGDRVKALQESIQKKVKETATPKSGEAVPVPAPTPATETTEEKVAPPPVAPTPTDAPVPPPAAPAPTEAPAVPFQAPKIVGLWQETPKLVAQILGKTYRNRIVYSGQFGQDKFTTTSDKAPPMQEHLQQMTQVAKDAGTKRVLVIYRIRSDSLKKVYEAMIRKASLDSGVEVIARERKIMSAADNRDAQIIYTILREGDDPEKIFKNYINYIKGEH